MGFKESLQERGVGKDSKTGSESESRNSKDSQGLQETT